MYALDVDGGALAGWDFTLRDWGQLGRHLWDFGGVRPDGCVCPHSCECGGDPYGGMDICVLRDKEATCWGDSVDSPFGSCSKLWKSPFLTFFDSRGDRHGKGSSVEKMINHRLPSFYQEGDPAVYIQINGREPHVPNERINGFKYDDKGWLA